MILMHSQPDQDVKKRAENTVILSSQLEGVRRGLRKKKEKVAINHVTGESGKLRERLKQELGGFQCGTR